MKIKTLVSGCLVCLVVVFAVHEFSVAQPIAGPSSNIGIVSVPRAMRDCKPTVAYGVKVKAEAAQTDAEERALADEVGVLTGGVKALVPGTSDHLAQYKLLLQKQASLKAMQEFNSQQRGLSQQRWAEKIYKEILRITKEVAEQKGLDLVLEREEPRFPIPGAEQLMMTLNTHKVLYGGGCVDITDEVIAELDKLDSQLLN